MSRPNHSDEAAAALEDESWTLGELMRCFVPHSTAPSHEVAPHRGSPLSPADLTDVSKVLDAEGTAGTAAATAMQSPVPAPGHTNEGVVCKVTRLSDAVCAGARVEHRRENRGANSETEGI